MSDRKKYKIRQNTKKRSASCKHHNSNRIQQRANVFSVLQQDFASIILDIRDGDASASFHKRVGKKNDCVP